MIQSKYIFRIEEVQLSIPKQGSKKYLIESTNYINYAKNIQCNCKKEISISIQTNENQPYVRLVSVDVEDDDFQFSDGSYAMRDIIKKTRSIYSKLLLRLSRTGEIIGVDNLQELQSLWSSTKEYLKSNYKGSQIQRYLFKMDTVVNSEEEVIKEVLLYHNFGSLLKPIYQKYSSESFNILLQKLSTKYGKVEAKEQLMLQAIKETGEIQLQLQAHHPENEEYVTVNGTYNYFSKQNESWLQQAIISSIEKYGRQEYQSTVRITQL